MFLVLLFGGIILFFVGVVGVLVRHARTFAMFVRSESKDFENLIGDAVYGYLPFIITAMVGVVVVGVSVVLRIFDYIT